MKVSIRRGLTLIELTVVLLILAATAGILVPRLVGYVGRAHGATGADNMQEISKALALYETNTGEQPNGFDSLLIPAGTVSPTLFDGVPAVPPFAPLDLTALGGEEVPLNAIGITQVFDLAVTPDNATFGANEPGAVDVDATATLCQLTDAGKASIGLTTNDTVVAFGLGEQSAMLGTVMTEAPFHFPEGGEKPEDIYLRFYVFYQVADVNGVFEKARPLGVYCLEPDNGEITTIGTHLNEYYENRDR